MAVAVEAAADVVEAVVAATMDATTTTVAITGTAVAITVNTSSAATSWRMDNRKEGVINAITGNTANMKNVKNKTVNMGNMIKSIMKTKVMKKGTKKAVASIMTTANINN
jgi:hypothetical protein